MPLPFRALPLLLLLPSLLHAQVLPSTIPLPKPNPLLSLPLAPRPPGKYLLTLRVKLTPTDAAADEFLLAAGPSARSFKPFANPDPANPDFRLWSFPLLYDGKSPLTLSLLRPKNAADRPASAITLDRLDLRPVGPAYIQSIRPSKVCYDPNDTISVDVLLHAPSPGLTLRALESSALDDPREVASLPVPSPAPAKLTLSWNAGPQQYGREVRIELLQNNTLLDAASDFYNVSDNVWKVAMAAPISGLHMSDPRSIYCSDKTEDQLATDININTRASYGNFHEAFAWAPDDAFDMTPTQPTWISGQGAYQHQRDRILLANKLLLANGIWPITYAKSAASGPPAFDFMRTHPDLALSGFQSQFDQEYVEKWNLQTPGQDKTVFYSWMSCVLNVADPRVIDLAVNEILRSSDMFGWRGARYDDHYTLWNQPNSDTSTRNMQRIFDLAHPAHPSFVFGFNYLTSNTPFAWPKARDPGPPWPPSASDASAPDPPNPRQSPLPKPYPEFAIACQNASFIMNEEARGAAAKSMPYPAPATFSNYDQLLTLESRLTRSLGGHYGVIPFDAPAPTSFDALFPDLLRLASRSHSYAQIRGGPDLLRFVTRYSAFLYGTDLSPIPDPQPLLRISSSHGLWYHNHVYRYTTPSTDALVLHLLAAPHADAISQNTDGLLPPIRVDLTYTGPGSLASATELSPFLDSFHRSLPISNNSLQLPDLHLYSVLILQLKK